MSTFNTSNYHRVNCLKFGDLFFTSLTKLELEAKASNRKKLKKQILHSRRLLVPVTPWTQDVN